MNKKIGKLLALSAMSGMMCLGTASAADKGMKHSAADFNGDGMVTKAEMMTHCEMNFMKMDKDNDHMVDAKEWNTGWFLGDSFLDQ